VRLWDSSAVVPLLVAEETSDALQDLFEQTDEVAVWWATEVECASAVARLERTELLTAEAANEAFAQLQRLAEVWHLIDPVESVRLTAKRFLRVHDLRAADALQLAAAFLAAEGRPETLEIVSLDQRLTAAARREGFPVVGPATVAQDR
jgi:predicted nucleic acid-binding protein